MVYLRSAIIHPMDKKVIVHDGKIKLDGWAYSGGGNWVERVEVSPDGYVFYFCLFPLFTHSLYKAAMSGMQSPKRISLRRYANP